MSTHRIYIDSEVKLLKELLVYSEIQARSALTFVNAIRTRLDQPTIDIESLLPSDLGAISTFDTGFSNDIQGSAFGNAVDRSK